MSEGEKRVTGALEWLTGTLDDLVRDKRRPGRPVDRWDLRELAPGG